jgi:hypothetical protein
MICHKDQKIANFEYQYRVAIDTIDLMLNLLDSSGRSRPNQKQAGNTQRVDRRV